MPIPPMSKPPPVRAVLVAEGSLPVAPGRTATPPQAGARQPGVRGGGARSFRRCEYMKCIWSAVSIMSVEAPRGREVETESESRRTSRTGASWAMDGQGVAWFTVRGRSEP